MKIFIKLKNDNKILLSHFKMYWKILVYFLIITTIYTIGLISIYMFLDYKITIEKHLGGPYIGKIDMSFSPLGDPNVEWIFQSEYVSNNYSTLLSNFLFAGPTIAFLAISSVIFINKIFISEIKSGKIVSWLCLSISREKLIIMKSLAIIILNIILSSLIFFIILIFRAFATDANKYFFRLFWYCLQFIIFNIFLTSILIFIAVLLIKKQNFISIIIYTIIISYILITWFFYYMYKTNGGDISENNYINFKIFSYLCLDNLIINPLFFSSEFIKTQELDENNYWWIIKEYKLKDNIWLNIFIPIFYLGISSIIIYIKKLSFQKKIYMFKKLVIQFF
ncbi:hypothetical protein [Spiroplasma taiwanense]|uniref:Uncharacterized protein n=1 Tax=Spiroplasma taiwanense CT-1 TaxID=1276220 RepID=S5MHG1_9MOLU|nr:hypothetical protein [Spiroplasma taiwanense]AGR41280.1 hypothetical protein STAIW_v1c06620 [Spiroplasma taiwanense CT-1]